MPCHVRILTGSLKPTAGSHIYNRELIRRLAGRGHRVSVVCFDDGGDDWGDVELTTLPRCEWNSIPMAWRFATPLQGLRSRFDVATAALSKPDVVIAAEHLFLKPHARRFPQTPWLYLPHSLVIAHEIDSYGMSGLQSQLTQRFYVRQQRWALQHATGVVRFNQTAATALRDYYGPSLARAPFLINPVGIDVPQTEIARRSRRASARLNLLFTGRLVPSKNLQLVLQSLQPHRDQNWTLNVLGDGPDRETLQATAERLGLTGQVIFHGHQADLTHWYEQADLLVFPSKLESMGLSLLEAMAHGVPALVVREDGSNYRVPFSEVVDDRVTGLLARDEKDFAERLSEVIRRPASLSSLALNARRHVAEHYSWDRHLERFERQFEILCEPQSPRRLQHESVRAIADSNALTDNADAEAPVGSL